jgi:hypothetical protein
MTTQPTIKPEQREKILSFIEEGSLTFGVLTGGTIGLHIAASNLYNAVSNTHAVYSVLAGTHIGLMIGVTATYTLPIIAKSILPKHIDDDIEIKDLFTTHNHKASRLAGMASGVALSLALTWGSVASMAGKPINIEPVLQASHDFIESAMGAKDIQVADSSNVKVMRIYPPGGIPVTFKYNNPVSASLMGVPAEKPLSP